MIVVYCLAFSIASFLLIAYLNITEATAYIFYLFSTIPMLNMILYLKEVRNGKLKIFNHYYFSVFPISRYKLLLMEWYSIMKSRHFLSINGCIFFIFSLIIIKSDKNNLTLLAYPLGLAAWMATTIVIRNSFSWRTGLSMISLIFYISFYSFMGSIILISSGANLPWSFDFLKYNLYGSLIFELMDHMALSYIISASVYLCIIFYLLTKQYKIWRSV